MTKQKLDEAAKAAIAFIIAVIMGAIAQGLIVGASAAWLTIIIGALTTAGVYVKKNAPPAGGG